MASKTRDGIRLKTVISALEQIAGVTIRPGNNHPFIAEMDGYATSCPIASSTDARRMIVPWIKKHTSYKNARDIYNALRYGEWPNDS
jgi:hypothetical protein